MFTGVNQAAAGTAKKKMIQGIDKKLYPHVIFYKGELKKYKDELDFEKKDIPYFFVLDKQGKIVYATSGAFNNKKLDEIYYVLEEE
jgi:predicted transcriptional regulator